MKPLVRALLALVTAGLILSGCSSPKPTLFSLDPVPGPIINAPKRVILIRQVSIARYLDRSPIVRSSYGYRIILYQNDWWGELPSPMMTRVLAENLGQRLPASTVLPETVVMTVQPDLSVEVSVQTFDLGGAGKIVLTAAYALPGLSGSPPPQTFRTAVTPPSPDVTGQVAAMSEAFGKLADAIALRIAAEPRRR